MEEVGSDSQPDLATRIFERNVELENENRWLREQLMLVQMTPTDVAGFEQIRKGRKPWAELRKTIESRAEEKYRRGNPPAGES